MNFIASKGKSVIIVVKNSHFVPYYRDLPRCIFGAPVLQKKAIIEGQFDAKDIVEGIN